MDEYGHSVPRKINVPPPMILGMSGPQSFAWVSTMIVFGMIASSFDGIGSAILAWLIVAVVLFIEVAVIRFINSRRRALIPHTFKRIVSMMKIKRYAGRGISFAWGGTGHRGGERPY